MDSSSDNSYALPMLGLAGAALVLYGLYDMNEKQKVKEGFLPKFGRVISSQGVQIPLRDLNPNEQSKCYTIPSLDGQIISNASWQKNTPDRFSSQGVKAALSYSMPSKAHQGTSDGTNDAGMLAAAHEKVSKLMGGGIHVGHGRSVPNKGADANLQVNLEHLAGHHNPTDAIQHRKDIGPVKEGFTQDYAKAVNAVCGGYNSSSGSTMLGQIDHVVDSKHPGSIVAPSTTITFDGVSNDMHNQPVAQYTVNTLIYAANTRGRYSKARGVADMIRGDLPIVPCNQGWFYTAPTPAIDLQSGAFHALGGLDNATNKQTLALIQQESGSSTSVGSGGPLTNAQKIALSGLTGSDIEVKTRAGHTVIPQLVDFSSFPGSCTPAQ